MAESPELLTFHLLREVTVEYGLRQGEFAARNGMHPTDVRALICLLDAERAGTDATAGWLGERLGLNSAGTTAVVDRLERLGHVARVRDTRDRRRVLLTVEDRAKELGRAHFGPLVEGAVALLDGFEEGEKEAVRRFLTGVRDLMSDGEES
ncbi:MULTISPECIES: MarR family winged helix-turn-helix transcriptional regulator [unclassified Streptomyces]|uniref:MarR family winged helix-turn-helix transcriptional regulator n=1 Tax=unclassified Streptomyces TaxID=2593676 RepID=UPI001E5C0FBC|nr:MarR family winged helix-turn-helix transcriptional regulator [Streptomyces sp. CB02980]MCB8906691.1 MarR family winged helix-turn-helix transcriptional regulator [Streptomyces sp. CB02980]